MVVDGRPKLEGTDTEGNLPVVTFIGGHKSVVL